jgi:hypothetical protein
MIRNNVDTPVNSLKDSNVNPKWKQWKKKELGYAPYLAAF